MLFLLIKIFVVRIIDVSLGTFRTILTVKGKRTYASAIGFIEVLIWFLIVREALNTDAGGIIVGIAYAGGFSTGTFIGGLLSEKFISYSPLYIGSQGIVLHTTCSFFITFIFSL